ncbi:MAG: heavy metal-associated domain-containing protein [Bacteroidetes bacterium]|nr:heavy metal-associated domain-containing protein [Bacteroidota bacterium]
MAFLAQTTMAQDKKAGNMATIKIKTSSVCGMCKETIEKAMAFEKGVKTSDLDTKTKIVTVTYNTEKTTPEKIKLAISKAGYDADEVKADPKAYAKLSPCCKKDSKMH